MLEKKSRGEGQGAWVVDHLKYITKRDKALDALDFYLELNDRNMHPDRVTQDVLILSSRKDHFIPFKMYKVQIQALASARSVTGGGDHTSRACRESLPDWEHGPGTQGDDLLTQTLLTPR